jgi:hypothetical protein
MDETRFLKSEISKWINSNRLYLARSLCAADLLLCECYFVLLVSRTYRAVIPNLEYVCLYGYEPGHLGVREKKFNNIGERHIHQQQLY